MPAKSGASAMALIIANDVSVASLLRRSLQVLDIDATIQTTAEGAESFLIDQRARLVLLDLCLPGMTGGEWLCRFRRRNSYTPVMIVSATYDANLKAELIRVGADDFVSRPFHVVELEARVLSLLRRANGIPRTIVRGAVALDLARMELAVSGVRCSLTQREFGILWFLLVHEGDWVETRLLADGVLGTANGSDLGCMRVHISHLRHKLATFSKAIVIGSSRHSGYRVTFE